MNVVSARRLPPVGPVSFPTDCSKRHGIEPLFGQLVGSEPASIPFTLTIHTRLLSRELCHVALPLRGGTMPGFGFSLMLWKWVIISPNISENRVASGRAVGLQAVPPSLAGRQV
jgi:hypothetical protein